MFASGVVILRKRRFGYTRGVLGFSFFTKTVAILEQMQAGRPALIQKDGDKMLAIVLDRPLADAKVVVDDPAAFTQEMTRILLEKQSHPLIAHMIKPAGSSDPPPSKSAASSSGSHEHHSAGAPVQFQ